MIRLCKMILCFVFSFWLTNGLFAKTSKQVEPNKQITEKERKQKEKLEKETKALEKIESIKENRKKKPLADKSKESE
ncbi:hypothetical protein [Aureibacter tunicatorum]|uniref:Uncharacterized protein n=1 Tax=Aureibacter tunicatorum TaxID=866807 RepID=A0AAE4BUQ7_9BACT|nr:hypothetical protein [Aureibacter tunicatorum]MDR6242021.1 hypothetical protein [Aureibacter tunicatorum]BDD07134.1 hypothetical protein AUTU_46170 [Aureibacter tunicatorum]